MGSLPAVPAHKLPAPTGLTARVVRTASLVTAWDRAVDAALKDPALRNAGLPREYGRPENAARFLGSDVLRPHDLGSSSQWVFLQVTSLLTTLSTALADSANGNAQLQEFGLMLNHMGPRILWDTLLDLSLAERLASHRRFTGRFPATEWSVKGVAELRAGVLYLLNALSKVYGHVLDESLAERLHAHRFLVPDLGEALEYFGLYIEAYTELTRPPELPAAEPPRKWRWWRSE